MGSIVKDHDPFYPGMEVSEGAPDPMPGGGPTLTAVGPLNSLGEDLPEPDEQHASQPR